MKSCCNFSAGIFLAVILFLSSCRKDHRFFVGGFTRNDGERAMTVFDLRSNGKLSFVASADVGPNPSYFCFSEKNSIFYVANEVMEFGGQFGGGMSTFRYNNKDVRFEKLNEMLIPYGGPCFISMSYDSSFLFLANYPNGSVAVVKLDEKGIPVAVTDTILFVKEEPDRSHAHMILHDPAGKYVYVTDLGLDRIVTFTFDSSTGKLQQTKNGIAMLPPGSGPRHFTFNADGSKLYVINELGSLVTVFVVKEDGSLDRIQLIETKADKLVENNYCADIHMDMKGRFLYGSNRGENTIVTYAIGDDGLLNLAGHISCGGDWPRNFTLDPSGRFILVGNQKSDYISVLKIDKNSGIPSLTSDSAKVKMPACLKFFSVD